jgi:hypothetical protein
MEFTTQPPKPKCVPKPKGMAPTPKPMPSFARTVNEDDDNDIFVIWGFGREEYHEWIKSEERKRRMLEDEGGSSSSKRQTPARDFGQVLGYRNSIAAELGGLEV